MGLRSNSFRANCPTVHFLGSGDQLSLTRTTIFRHDLMETIKKSEENKWTTIARTMACCSSQTEEEVDNVDEDDIRKK